MSAPNPKRSLMLRQSTLLAAALAVSALAACDTYDPPPRAGLLQPADGRWTKNTPLVFDFSEAIDPDTLVVSVWPYSVDPEGNFRPEARPIVEGCSLATSPCGTFAMTINDSHDRVVIEFNDTFDDYEGVPLVLVVHEGLRDPAGRTRKVADRYDFQVSPLCGAEPIDIDLQTGVISLTANLQVLPIWLHLYMDVAIDPDTGTAVVVASFARVGEGLPTNYNHPDGFEPAIDSTGWTVTFTACLIDRKNGTFFMQSDPFDVNIVVLNTIPVTLEGFQVQGTIAPGSEAEGRDFASGTLSTTGGSFGDPPNVVDPITSNWDGFSFLASEIPEGLPRVCADAPCATMDEVGGDCQLPTPWVPGAVCPAAE